MWQARASAVVIVLALRYLPSASSPLFVPSLATLQKSAPLRFYNVMHSTIELLINFAGWTQQTASLARM
jgi:hypothetical protein